MIFVWVATDEVLATDSSLANSLWLILLTMTRWRHFCVYSSRVKSKSQPPGSVIHGCYTLVPTLSLWHVFSKKFPLLQPGWGWWSWRFKARIARFGGKSRPKRPEGLQGKQTSNASAELGEYCEGCQWASTRGYGWGRMSHLFFFPMISIDTWIMGSLKSLVETGDHRTPITESNKPLLFWEGPMILSTRFLLWFIDFLYHYHPGN